jgi:hypothetical protein
MLRSTSALRNYVLETIDGELGRCKDFLFDDQSWVLRYMVADTHKWLPGRKVLIPVISLGRPDWDRRRFPVHLTKEAVETSPRLDEDAPVSRIEERRWALHYGHALYWTGAATWGSALYPDELRDRPEGAIEDVADTVHVRSTREITGYQVHAIDGLIGRVNDFVIDDGDWRVSHVVCAVDARVRAPIREGEAVQALISPADVVSIDWASQMLNVGRMRADLVLGTEKRNAEAAPSRP